MLRPVSPGDHTIATLMHVPLPVLLVEQLRAGLLSRRPLSPSTYGFELGRVCVSSCWQGVTDIPWCHLYNEFDTGVGPCMLHLSSLPFRELPLRPHSHSSILRMEVLLGVEGRVRGALPTVFWPHSPFLGHCTGRGCPSSSLRAWLLCAATLVSLSSCCRTSGCPGSLWWPELLGALASTSWSGVCSCAP